MKRSLTIAASLITQAGLLLAACAQNGSELTEERPSQERTLFVGPEEVDCEGVGPQRCLLVKEQQSSEYLFFYDHIEGFQFESGFEYEILVRVDRVRDAPSDSSTLKYSLIEVVSKTPASDS